MNFTLDFNYVNEDIDNKNLVKDILTNNNVIFREFEDEQGIHLEYDSSNFEKIKNLLNENEEFRSKNANKINRYLKIDNNGININLLQAKAFDEYTGAGMTNIDDIANNDKFAIRYQLRSTYEKPIFVIEKRVENDKKISYEDITYMVLKETKCQILEKMYADLKSKELQKGVHKYKKDELLNSILKYENRLLDENKEQARKYEARRMNDILLDKLKDNLEEVQNLYDKSNIIASGWGSSIQAFETFKKGFDELCKKYNIKEEVYTDKYFYNKTGNEKRLKINNEAIGDELKNIIKDLNKGKPIDIDKILNNKQLQYVINSKNNFGEETINIPGREKMHFKYINEYLNNIKSVSGKLDNDGKMMYNGNILKNKQVNIVIGYPASGKSTISNQISNFSQARIVDSDEVKKLLPEYCNGLGVEKVHEESKQIMRKMLTKCIDNCENIVLPIVGAKPQSIERYLKVFTNAGYDIRLTLVDLPKEKCMARNLMRYIETGRLIHPQKLNDYTNPKDVLNMIKEDIRQQGDNYKYNIRFIHEYNNDVPFGHKPELVECYKVSKTLQDITQVAKIQYNQSNIQITQNQTNTLKLK